MRRTVYPVLGALCALLALELLVRQVFVLREVEEPGYGLIPAPESTIVWGREGHARSHWTKHGIRGKSLPPRESATIVVLGDSQTQALMVEDDEVFTGLTEARLKASDPGAPAVLNAGRSSASIADYVAYAGRFESLFAPRWVVLVLQESDLQEDAFDPTKTHFVVGPAGSLEARAVLPRPRSRFGTIVWNLRQRSMLVGYATVRLMEFWQPSSSDPPLFRAGSPRPEPVARRVFPVEQELDLAQSTYRGRVSFLLLSTFDPVRPGEPSPFERRVLEHCATARLHCLTPRAGYPAIAREGGAPFGHVNTRFNYGHLNRIGHRAVADALVRHIGDLRANGLF